MRKKSLWVKGKSKKAYESSYQWVSLNKKPKRRCFVLTKQKGEIEDVELFESHEKAKAAGWKKL